MSDDRSMRFIYPIHALAAVMFVPVFHVLGGSWLGSALISVVWLFPAAVFVFWIPLLISACSVFSGNYRYDFPLELYYIAFGYIVLYYLAIITTAIVAHYRNKKGGPNAR